MTRTLPVASILGRPPGRFQRTPIWGCTAPRHVIALGAAALRVSVEKGVLKIHLLQTALRMSVEQVTQTPV